jgi:phenylalanine-4-hydroxylase
MKQPNWLKWIGEKNLGEPSEMALLSRLHWWTVEYGLIGTLENQRFTAPACSLRSANRSRAWSQREKNPLLGRRARTRLSISPRNSRSFSSAAISSICERCSKNLPARWRIKVGGLEGHQQSDRMQ